MGLHLHINRTRWQRAHEVRQGIEIAFNNKDPLPSSYFEAIASSRAEALEMEDEENCRRAEARFASEHHNRSF